MTNIDKSILWEATDYKGRYVVLTTERFEHIKIGHPEMTGFADVIKETIEQPQLVVQSKKYADTEIHSRYDIGEETFRNKWLHVPVLYYVGGTGSVTTAYMSYSVKQGKVIYSKIKL